MRRARKTMPDSRFWSESQTASRLGRSVEWLKQHMGELVRAGLPAKDPIVGLYSRERVEAWIDRRAGIVGKGNNEFHEILDVINGLKKEPSAHGQPTA